MSSRAVEQILSGADGLLAGMAVWLNTVLDAVSAEDAVDAVDDVMAGTAVAKLAQPATVNG